MDTLQEQVTDFLVETRNPEMLDVTLASMTRARVIGCGTQDGIVTIDGYPVVRVFGDPGFFKFAVKAQGYCKIIKQLDEPI